MVPLTMHSQHIAVGFPTFRVLPELRTRGVNPTRHLMKHSAHLVTSSALHTEHACQGSVSPRNTASLWGMSPRVTPHRGHSDSRRLLRIAVDRSLGRRLNPA